MVNLSYNGMSHFLEFSYHDKIHLTSLKGCPRGSRSISKKRLSAGIFGHILFMKKILEQETPCSGQPCASNLKNDRGFKRQGNTIGKCERKMREENVREKCERKIREENAREKCVEERCQRIMREKNARGKCEMKTAREKCDRKMRENNCERKNARENIFERKFARKKCERKTVSEKNARVLMREYHVTSRVPKPLKHM